MRHWWNSIVLDGPYVSRNPSNRRLQVWVQTSISHTGVPKIWKSNFIRRSEISDFSRCVRSGFVIILPVGSYPAAVSAFLSGQDVHPDLSAHVSEGNNYGFGLNVETVIGDSVRLFGRLGWNEGTKEIYQFAESDRTAAIGGDIGGRAWHRPTHRVGIAFAANGLASAHRRYLELGGQSYLLGDGGLTYGHEKILEAYYNLPLTHGIFIAFDVQQVWNPGYNRDRGPAIIFGLRLHAEADLHFH